MLICDIIQSLESMEPNRLSYFFCQAGVPTMNNATSVLRGLTYGLVRYHPCSTTALSHVRKEFDLIGDQMFKGPNLWQNIRTILTAILKDPLMKQIVLIVDALDECEKNLEELLNFIVETNSKLGTKWLVSSRNWPIIMDRLCQVVNSEKGITVDLEDSEDLISGAVESFTEDRLMGMSWWRTCDENLRVDIKREFKDKSANTFLWVAMVCQQLNKSTATQARYALNKFPSGLDKLYERMIDKLDAEDSAERCKEILAVVSTSYRPLDLKELASAVESLSEYRNDIGALTETVLLCGSFLTLLNGTTTVVFVHHSARDFLMEKALERIMPSGIPEQHNQMFRSSLEVMAETMCDFDSPGSWINSRSSDHHPLEQLGYACTYWVDHLQDSRVREIQGRLVDGFIEVFLHQHLLHWLQALGQLRNVSKGILSLHSLSSILADTQVPDLRKLVEDARRVSLSFGNAIEEDPLQSYASALLFSPVNSLVRGRFQFQRPSWVTKTPVVDEEWGSCVQVLEGHRCDVNALTFSSDDLLIASGSGDETIRVWDSMTGLCLENHHVEDRCVDSIIFIEGQGCLSSGACLDHDTRTMYVRVWDSAKESLRTMPGGKDSIVRSSRLSPDGKWLACRALDKVLIWEVQSGTLIPRYPKANYSIQCISFANNSQRLVLGSRDCGTVAIWNTTTWTPERTLRDHKSPISSIACAAKVQLFVSVSSSGVILVQDITSGISKQKIKTSHRFNGDVAFSGDGKRIAAECGNQGEFWIWDVSSGQHIHTLNSNQRGEITLALSSNGYRLISGSNNIEVWDITADSHAKLPTSRAERVVSVALSKDTRWAATGSNWNIKIWDVETLTCKHTLKGHEDCIVSMLFLDEQRLGSVSYDCTMIVWNFQKGTRLHTLTGHKAYVPNFVFLSEKDQLISGSFDGTIRTWNIGANHRRNHSFTASSEAITSITLSACRQSLISVHHHGEIKFWDLDSWKCQRSISIGGYKLNSMAMDQNCQWVAVSHNKGFHGSTLEVLHVATGLRICSERFQIMISDLSFDNNGTNLKSNVGVFNLSLPDVEEHQEEKREILMRRQGYGISSDKSWILKDDQKILWIPENYRPRTTAMSGSTLFMGCMLGHVQRITFSTNDNHSSGDPALSPSRSRQGSATFVAPLTKRTKHCGLCRPL